MSKRRFVLTPDEALKMARAAYECKFGGHQQSLAEKVEKLTPTLLPKPERVLTPKAEGVSIAELRKAQKAERARRRFNKAVKKSVVRKSKALTAAMRAQIRAAKAAYRAAMRQLRAQAQAALKAAEAAKRAAETLRKQVEAARQWLRLEALRQRNLNRAVKERIQKARACGFRLLSTFCSQEQWGASCPLQGHIRGLAAAAAVIWAAEQK